MNKKSEMNEFIICCLELGKELLEKDTLTKKESNFIKQLDTIIEGE